MRGVGKWKGMAAFFDRWAQSNVVENCWIENTGRDGLYFQGWEPGRGASDGITTLAACYCNKFNVVTNNVIYDVGRFGGSMQSCIHSPPLKPPVP